MNTPHFDFETLHAYKLAMDFTLFVRTLKVSAIDRKVFNHLVESADSAVLNIAEGRGRTGRARLNHYEIALGSAGEAAAALDIIRRGKRDAYSEKIRRVGGMLAGLSR